MVDQSLLNYIRQNLDTGFSENEIRQKLIEAGWEKSDVDNGFAESKPKAPVQPVASPAAAAAPAAKPVKTRAAARELLTATPERAVRNPAELPADIIDHPAVVREESFMQKNYRMLALAAGAIIILPIVAYGAFWSFKKLGTESPPPAPLEQGEARPERAAAPVDTAAAGRDKQRVADIQILQNALSVFAGEKDAYPLSLAELVSSQSLAQIPLDPKTGQEYLYIPLNDPPDDYSLSFVLEAGVGKLKKGLHEVTASEILPADALRAQEEAVQGTTTVVDSANLFITDLSKKPFYPGEEMTLALETDADLEYAVMTAAHLKLTDQSRPFGFRFSAPTAAGSYDVKIHGFTRDGKSLQATTKFTVNPKR